MDQYEIMEQIGRGAFGAAILVNHKIEKTKYISFSIYIFLQLGIDWILMLCNNADMS